MVNKHQASFLANHHLSLAKDPSSTILRELYTLVPRLATNVYYVYTPFKNVVLEAIKHKHIEEVNHKAVSTLQSKLIRGKPSDISSYIRAYGLGFNDSIILGRDSSYLMEQLLWRIFYYQAEVDDESLTTYKWKIDKELQEKFFNARTGFPVIDASIHCLKKTGKLSNKLRMTVASFFCKNMLQPWMDGEKFFAKYLEDYDRVVNRGNWIWCSQLRYDNQQFIRFLKPDIQLKKLLQSEEGREWYEEWRMSPCDEVIDWDSSCRRYREWKNLHKKNV